jgi:quercetin dioxygenase-like cupin family protein
VKAFSVRDGDDNSQQEFTRATLKLGSNVMKARDSALRAAAIVGVSLAALWNSAGSAQEQPAAKELPGPSEISGIKPEVLIRTTVPGVPWKIELVTRVTYEPGARIRKHYHTGQVVFYILEGAMVVQHEDGSLMTLKPADTLLIKPGTVHAHWNASAVAPLVFTEFIILDEGQRSAVFVEQ